MHLAFGSTSIIALVSLFAAVFAAPAHAQHYPTKPVRMLVGFPGGGSVDIAARIIGTKLSEKLGQSVLIENKPGLAGNLAADIAAKSEGDGYTLYVATSVNAVSPSLFKKINYDPVKDFSPVARWITTSYMLIVEPSLPVKSVKDLVDLAKQKPGQINYGTTGNGSPAHLAAELLKLHAGIDVVHVPYKGGPQVINDMLGGRVHLSFSNIPVALPHVRSNRVRAVAVTSLERSPLVPELPTVAESGYPGFEVISWYGLVAPRGTPSDVVARLHRETNAILSLPEVRTALAAQGLEPAPQSISEFGAFIQAEVTKYAKLISDAKIKPD